MDSFFLIAATLLYHGGLQSREEFDYRMRANIIRSCILAIHKVRIFLKNVLKNKGMVFKNGVKNIQAAAYNGALTVIELFFKTKISTKRTCFSWLDFID